MDNIEKEYTNGEITIIWRSELCDHSGICISELPEVFNTIKRPWINMKNSNTKAIKRVVDMCPTKALTWKQNASNEKKNEPNEGKTIISLVKNGPIRISGNFSLINEDNNVVNCFDKISLCRCNKSKKSPFCDGSHKRDL